MARKIDEPTARRLAAEAVYRSDRYLDSFNYAANISLPFFIYDGLSEPPAEGSFGYFAVNPWTGDVWALWGCHRMSTPALRKSQAAIRRHFGRRAGAIRQAAPPQARMHCRRLTLADRRLRRRAGYRIAERAIATEERDERRPGGNLPRSRATACRPARRRNRFCRQCGQCRRADRSGRARPQLGRVLFSPGKRAGAGPVSGQARLHAHSARRGRMRHRRGAREFGAGAGCPRFSGAYRLRPPIALGARRAAGRAGCGARRPRSRQPGCPAALRAADQAGLRNARRIVCRAPLRAARR